MNNTLKRVGLFVVAVCAAQTSVAGVSGFVDAQAVMGTNASAGATASNTIGFGITDGAVYMSKDLGKGKALLDLPFQYSTLGATTVGSFGFAAAAKAQAYVNFGYDFGLDWTLGRFDSPFVNEANDSIDLAYAFQSGLYSFVPIIHQGLKLHYANSGFEVSGLVGNKSGQATRETAQGTGSFADNYEYALLAKYTHDMFWAGAGLYMHKPSGGTETGMLIDVNGGTKINDMVLSLDFVHTKPASTTSSGFALAGNFWYNVNKTWGVGIRPEYNSKATNYAALVSSANYSQFQVTAGSSCALTDDLKVRLNYVFASTKGNSTAASATWTDAGTSTTSHGGVISAAYRL